MNDVRYDGEIPLGEIHIIEETNRNFKLSSKVLEPEEMLSVLLAAINKVYSDFLGYENNGLILSKEGQIVFDLLEKINKYKSIEEYLGCSLEVVFKAIEDGIVIIGDINQYGAMTLWLDNKPLEALVGEKHSFEEPRLIKYNEWCFDVNSGSYIGCVKLKDYKKTWWLKENLEAIENERY